MRQNNEIGATELNFYTNKRDCVPAQTRKINPTRRSVSGRYVFRGEQSIPFESTLERDFIIRKEFFLHVLDIIPQPVQIPFTTSGNKSFIYTPDFLVYDKLGSRSVGNYPKPTLVEVKPRKEIQKNWSKWKNKFKAACHYAREEGWVFRIYDETRIRDQAFKNIRFLERYKRMQFPTEETRLVLDNVKKMGNAPFHYIIARHFQGIYIAQGIAHIWHLLATRQLDCDITQPLSDYTVFWVPTNE